jgi:hypothetical protein
MGNTKENASFSPGQEKNKNHRQYKIRHRTARGAAEKKIGSGQQYIADKDNRDPGAERIPVKTVTNIHQAHSGKDYSRNHNEQIKTGPRNVTDNTGRKSKNYAAQIGYVEQSRFQGNSIRKNISVNKFLYLFHSETTSTIQKFL